MTPGNRDYERSLSEITLGGARRLTGLVELVEYDPGWPGAFAAQALLIAEALDDRALSVEHVGSTSVPGLVAKPVIDIVLEVRDSSQEAAYVPHLQAAAYELRIREPGWYEHRMLFTTDPVVHLHVFSTGCSEIRRMVSFRDRLRASLVDRERYAARKRELAAQPWTYMQQYADAKTEVISEILAGG